MRQEKDTMGEVLVPDEVYWGAQTQRSLMNFKIGDETLPIALTHAMALVKKNAALYVADSDAPQTLIDLAIETVKDDAKLNSLSESINKLGLKNSADIIADEVIKLAMHTNK